jgi:hypothetical protein
MKGCSWVTLALGIWLLASPFVLHFGPVLTANDLICGTLTVVSAIWSLMTPPENHLGGWLGVVVGFWQFSSPWALGVIAGAVPLADNALVGTLIIMFALLRTLSGPLPTQKTA